MTLEEKIKKFPTVKRNNCRACGNPWWFDQGKQGWVCTTCYKTHGKDSSEEKEECESNIVDLAIAGIGLMASLGESSNSSSNDDNSSSGNDWEGDGGEFSGGGASDDW